MQTILDTTMDIFKSMGLNGESIPTPPGYAGLVVDLPNDFQAYLVWHKMDDNDFSFRVARFFENDSQKCVWVMKDLISAISAMRVLTTQ